MKTLNHESRNVKLITLLASKLKIEPGELALVLLSIVLTLMVLNSLSHTLVTALGMAYPLFLSFKVV